MTRYSFNNYHDLKQAVIKHILTSDKHIILEGKGNNGKSALLRELRLFIMDHNFEFRNHPEDTYEDLTLDESEPDEEDNYFEVSDGEPGEEKELKIFEKSIIHSNVPITNLPGSDTYYFDFSFNESNTLPPHLHHVLNRRNILYRCFFGGN